MLLKISILLTFCLTSGLADDYMFVGCYADRAEARDLAEMLDAGEHCTKQFCLIFCKSRGYKYFGLQGGAFCTCGNHFGIYADNRTKVYQKCNQTCTCTGDSSATCGGHLMNEIFETRLVPENTQRIGCFADTDDKNLTNVNLGRHATRQLCLVLCRSKGFKYFGMQASSVCFCVNEYRHFGEAVDDSECNMKCTGDLLTTCGGHLRNEIFKTGIFTSRTVERIGCFADTGRSGSEMTAFLYNNQMTKYTCQTHCTSLGHLYFALQSGTVCYCGNRYGRYGKLNDSECNIKCGGDPTTNCGGLRNNDVFRTGLVRLDPTRLGCYRILQDSDMTVSNGYIDGSYHTTRLTCLAYCKSQGYMYFGVAVGFYMYLCACGNGFSRYGNVSDSLCSVKCIGDNSTTCGGNLKYETFETGLFHGGVLRIGCFVDRQERDLEQMRVVNGSSRRRVCQKYCMSMGYKYFGMQNGDRCSCGNKYGRYGQTIDSECNQLCQSSWSETCGGLWRNEIFETNLFPDALTRVGCFSDDRARDLRDMHFVGGNDTRRVCRNYCSLNGYRYFGMQGGDRCSCGNKYGTYGKVVDSECNLLCQGSRSETCGGHRRNEIFETGLIPDEMRRWGCFEDKKSYRCMAEMRNMGKHATRQLCLVYCKSFGYKYLGVQAGTFCFCANYHSCLSRSDSECNEKCAGDSNITCGGNLRNEIFETGLIQSETRRIGCFRDDASNGDLTAFYNAASQCTIELCLTRCRSLGYKYAGLRDGYTCHCGNSYGRYGQVNDAECNITCYGDSNVMCGGMMRNEIYETGLLQEVIQSIGCYVEREHPSPDMIKRLRLNNHMTRQICLRHCKMFGFKYFAMQPDHWCRCGNSLGLHGNASDRDCNSACIGEPNATCGGNMRNEIFKTGLVPDYTRRMGCFLDRSDDRDLTELYTPGKHATRHLCLMNCKILGYKYFGMQGGSLCFCGNAFGKFGQVNDSKCKQPCTGDIESTCGGNLTNEVFESGLIEEAAITRAGCFVAAAHGYQDLPETRFYGRHNTIQLCVTYCRTKGYLYAGLHAGHTCNCGYTFGHFGSSDNTQCNVNCPGDPQMTCGAGDKNEVFQTGVIPFDAHYAGCYLEIDWAIFGNVTFTKRATPHASVQYCINHCQQSGRLQYAVIENNTFCHCGTRQTIDNMTRNIDPTNCNRKCFGSASNENCGGMTFYVAYFTTYATDGVKGAGLEDLSPTLHVFTGNPK